MKGRVLHFHLAGINNQNFLMQDEETGSWWQQVSGLAILGPLKGDSLTRVFHDEVTFARWRKENPGGRVLRPAADSAWKTFSANWEEETAHLPVRVNGPADGALAERAVIVGVVVAGHAKAYPVAALQRQSPIMDRLGGRTIVLVESDSGRAFRAFDATQNGATLEFFQAADSGSGSMRDATTGSVWDFSGVAVGGPLRGQRLTRLYVLKDYWFDWKIYHPETAVYLLGPR